MHTIRPSTDRGEITTNAVDQTVICSFQTMDTSRGHFFAKVRALAIGQDMAKAWTLSARFKRLNNGTPEVSTPVFMIVDGDATAASWEVVVTSNADGLISLECLGSNVETVWIGEFDAIQSTTHDHN